MVKKKIDNRIRVMIENGVKIGHRTMFCIVGDKGRDQVPILYDMLVKTTVKIRPSVLWLYKEKDEAISSHRKKRATKIKNGQIDPKDADLFDMFLVSTTIHGRYYDHSHTILGKTYGVCVLQDFEALTPNLLARTIETVEGGGLIILLLKTVSSLKQLFTMTMDVHRRYRTESHQDVVCRFNERLILSLADCERCLFLNDDLVVLPISSKTANLSPVDVASIGVHSIQEELQDLKESLNDVPIASQIINICKTMDQAKALTQIIDSLSEKNLRPPTCITAARGRGKSATMGLAVAAAIAFGYVNIYVTSPSPENLITLFEFILKGFDALEYQEHIDYTIIRSTNPEFNKSIIRINLTQKNRQTIQYIFPTDAHLLNAADLLLIDEAAAIPLPLVKKMLGSYLVFLSSTVNGYEGTGRSLSLKLMSQLKKENNAPPPIVLSESIRYSSNDPIESWLTSLLCLDATSVPHLSSGCPTPDVCELYYVDRDALFSYHKPAESFLQRIVSIYVSSHYKNSPNDLQMLSDAPAHHIFCLLGPVSKKDALPEVLVVVQVCLEGEISKKTVHENMSKRKNASGDLIPWNIAEQYGDKDFPRLAGARIIRIATHPNYQRMGYGKRAVQLLKKYYEGHFASLTEEHAQEENGGIESVSDDKSDLLQEVLSPRKKVPTLLKRLVERKPERLDYIGTSYGLTLELLRFWKSQSFVPVYLSQKENDLTGEHSCIMLCTITHDNMPVNWLAAYFSDFRRRVLRLFAKTFNKFNTGLALSLLDHKKIVLPKLEINQQHIDCLFIPHDIQRLESYLAYHVEYRLIMDLTPTLATLYFENKLNVTNVDSLQKAILLGVGMQNKNLEIIANELTMPNNQILAKFYDTIKKLTKCITKTLESTIECTLTTKNQDLIGVTPLESLEAEFSKDTKKLEKQQQQKLAKLKNEELSQFAIKGTEEDWSKALTSTKSKILSVKVGEKRLGESLEKQGFQKNKKLKFNNSKKKFSHGKKKN